MLDDIQPNERCFEPELDSELMDKGQLVLAGCSGAVSRNPGITEHRNHEGRAGNPIALQWKEEKREPDDSRT